MPDRKLWWTITGLAWTAFVVALESWYVIEIGPQHMLWLSHLGFATSAVLWWWPNRLAVSMLALTLVLVETGWCLDYLLGLPFGQSPTGATRYMFETDTGFPLQDERSRAFRLASLFHLGLPVVALILLYRTRYTPRAVLPQIALLWIVLPLAWWIGGERYNINWTHGFGTPDHGLEGIRQLLLMMLLLPVCLSLPSHFLFSRLPAFRPPESETSEREPSP